MPEPVVVGQIVAGKYRIDRLLGRGAMGIVMAATHVQIARPVALKFLLGEGPGQDVQEQRFLREAQAASMLRSQHVGKVLDVGRLEDGAPYIVMELLVGKDVAGVLKERGRLPIAEAVLYVVQVCEAVGEAHAAGIVHRDIKPANLFVTRRADGSPCVKVVDFGIAKVGGNENHALTGTVQALGSPLYMSPEQMKATRDVDAQADQWSLGVVLYEMLAGATPFAAPSVTSIVLRVFQEPPTPLTEHRADVPPALVAVIMRCLEKDPSRRWPSVLALAAALRPFTGPDQLAQTRVSPTWDPAAPAPQRPSAEPPPPPVVAPPAPRVASWAAATVNDPSTDAPAVVTSPRPPEPRAAPPAAARAASRAPAAVPAPRRSRVPAIVAAALALGLPVALFFGLRGRDAAPARAALATTATASPVATPAPTVPGPVVVTAEPRPVAPPPPAETVTVPTAVASASASAPVPTATATAWAPRARPFAPPPRPVSYPAAAPPPASPPRGPWEGSRQ